MRFYFEEADIWAQHKQQIADEINKIGAPLVVFGRSVTSNPEFLKKIRVPVEYICSNTPTSWGSRLWGLEVISPNRVQEIYQQYSVLILAVDTEDEIFRQVQQFAVPPVKIFKLDLHDEDGCAEYFFKMKPAIETIYERMGDQESRETYETILRYRINWNPALLERFALPAEPQYFPAVLGKNAPFLSENEVFVDGGAYTGDTVEAFLSVVHGKYRAIHAFEPEPENYRRLLENTKGFSNVTCWQAGLGDEPKKLGFSSRETGSKVDLSCKETIQVESLDHALAETPVTYLKMDIEGMECPALRGAKKLIQTYRPKLAICTYHSNQDMVEVPRLILGLNPDYQLFMRHYTTSLFETVCYAI